MSTQEFNVPFRYLNGGAVPYQATDSTRFQETTALLGARTVSKAFDLMEVLLGSLCLFNGMSNYNHLFNNYPLLVL